MGFTTGFTGGVTLVLGAAYLTLQSHQLTRQRQAETLRAQTYILNSLSYIPASAPPPKTIAEELALLEHQQELLAKAQQRRAERFGGAGFLERAKERWNAEVEAAVRWAANKDWIAAREDAENTFSHLWARATGGEPPSRTAERARAAISDKAALAATAARTTAEQTASRTKEAVHVKAVETKETGTSIWERGFRRSKEVASHARANVELAEEKIQHKATELASVIETDVEKVIKQRFERKPEEVLRQSAEEVLEERYKPVVEQNRSKVLAVEAAGA